LGACLRTERRTEQNDNDKAVQYFGKKSIPIPTEPALAKMGRVLPDDDDDDYSNNPLIQKLRQQSIDNKERNDLEVERKIFENNQVWTKTWCLLTTNARTQQPPLITVSYCFMLLLTVGQLWSV
jgi:hypothetical protein